MIRIEINGNIDVQIEMIRIDAIARLEAYKIKIIAETEAKKADILLIYQDRLVVETTIAIDKIELYYHNLYISTEIRIVKDYQIKITEITTFYAKKIEMDTTVIINTYNVKVTDITAYYDNLILTIRLQWESDHADLIASLTSDYDLKIYQYKIDIELRFEVSMKDLDDWLIVVIAEHQTKIDIEIKE